MVSDGLIFIVLCILVDKIMSTSVNLCTGILSELNDLLA